MCWFLSRLTEKRRLLVWLGTRLSEAPSTEAVETKLTKLLSKTLRHLLQYHKIAQRQVLVLSMFRLLTQKGASCLEPDCRGNVTYFSVLFFFFFFLPRLWMSLRVIFPYFTVYLYVCMWGWSNYYYQSLITSRLLSAETPFRISARNWMLKADGINSFQHPVVNVELTFFWLET